MNVLHVVGARPNFMKVAPVLHALQAYPTVAQALVHSGQHYDVNMSDVFFQQLSLPAPDVNLEVGSGSHTQQTAQIMARFEPVVLEHAPDVVLVYGDVNSTVAATLVCAKLGIRVGHVEAGLRSLDRTMPEEINRLVTDQLADILFTPSEDGNLNLAREGIASEKVHLVGNVMIDTLIRLLPLALHGWQGSVFDIQGVKVEQEKYVLVTLHRPSNVDDPIMLTEIIGAIEDIAKETQIIFPVHPRTRQRLAALGLASSTTNIRVVKPISYLDSLALQRHAALVITDSGGIQEETTFLGIPCLTVRQNTERPITVSLGTNQLVGRDMQRLRAISAQILAGETRSGQIPPLWDGKAGQRIADLVAAGC